MATGWGVGVGVGRGLGVGAVVGLFAGEGSAVEPDELAVGAAAGAVVGLAAAVGSAVEPEELALVSVSVESSVPDPKMAPRTPIKMKKRNRPPQPMAPHLTTGR